ncbi:glycosyltransferase family 4 protein [Dokdonella fugitiva]|uniref:glycosyltransferase family 4 protein n=1 Tax=Dokdonella fugitiva TaxID=328517 RepID=UPI001F546F94|nr:glycosyltransferase family 4 protein [Dokdonella fugitiva]
MLIVTRNLPPLMGGMERLNWHMAEGLSGRMQVRVVGPAGAAALAPPGVDVEEVALVPLPWFLLRAAWIAWRRACAWRADIVLAGSGLTGPLAWLAARACGARAMVYAHGLDMAVRHPLYRALWLPFLRRMDGVIANSRATARLATAIGVDPARIEVVHPGVDLPAHASHPASVAGFRDRHGLGRGPLLLSVGRLSTRKGLREFVEGVLPAIVAKIPDVVFLVVGDAPAQALHARAQSADSIRRAANARGIGGHVRFHGVVVDRAELALVYEAADVHVFPVREIPGDPEGFGMVAIEAAAHGLPTVAYATGGVVESVADGRSGRLVPPGDEAGMADAVVEILDRREAMRASCRSFAAGFAWPVFSEKVHRALGGPHD